MSLLPRSFAVCRLAVVPVRRFADMVSEMTTQVRFGESVEIIQENRGLWEIRLCQDEYTGWVDLRQFTDPQETPPPGIRAFTADTAGWAQSGKNRILLPAGSPLPGWDHGIFRIGPDRWQWNGAVHVPPPEPCWEDLLKEAQGYLSAPYFWGGRTLWGIDCSGLMQTLLRHQGIALQRDCVLQVGDGMPVESLREARAGDLAFFDGTRDGGRHVGLILEDSRILHASGFVRIDLLTPRGIVTGENGHLSHRLTSLRRVAEWNGIGG